MKILFKFILPVLLIFFQKQALAITITLQPNGASGKDAMIQHLLSDPAGDNTNYGNFGSLEAMAWTWSNQDGVVRGLLEFDLSSIPSNATVTDARLSLYNDPTSSENGGQHSSLTGSNVALLQRIIIPWNELSVTWNNQPATTTLHQVTLPQSTSPNQDYLNVDVTTIVNDMIQNSASSHGFLFRLVTESHWRAMIFASSDNANAARRPSITITYTVPAPLPVPALSTWGMIFLSIIVGGTGIMFIKRSA
jgi:hypothetical protein